MTFGRYVRERRKRCELGLNQTADMIGISTSYLSDIERGYRKPIKTKVILDNIAKVIKVPEEEMLDFYILAIKDNNEVAEYVINELQSRIKFLDEYIGKLPSYVQNGKHQY